MQSPPPVESLQCFVAGAKFLNFAKASQTVHLSPAAFGQRIRQFEDYVGLALFVRTTRRVSLTDAGRRLVSRAQHLLYDLEALPALANDKEVVVERNITIGTRLELGMSWLLPMLPKLEKAVPGATLHLHFGDSAELLQRLQNDQIDAAMCSVRLADRRFSFELLHEERYCLVASSKLVKQEGLRTLSSLKEQTLVDCNPTLPLARYWLDADKERANLQFRSLRYLGTIGAIRDYILRGEGVAVLPSYFVKGDLKRGRLKKLFANRSVLTDHFRLLFSNTRHHGDVFSRFVEVMRNEPLR